MFTFNPRSTNSKRYVIENIQNVNAEPIFAIFVPETSPVKICQRPLLICRRTSCIPKQTRRFLMYQLYGFIYSQHTRRVISLLEEVDIPYELKLVDMMNNEHMSTHYLAINPNHQVPTLVDGDLSIHESNAILRYLCVKHQLWDWYPKNTVSLARVEQWLDWNQCRLSPLVITLVMNRVFMGDKGDETKAQEAELAIKEICLILDEHLAKHLFISGANPSIADLSLASNIFQLGMANAIPQLPNISRWYTAVSELKGFQRSLPEN